MLRFRCFQGKVSVGTCTEQMMVRRLGITLSGYLQGSTPVYWWLGVATCSTRLV